MLQFNFDVSLLNILVLIFSPCLTMGCWSCIYSADCHLRVTTFLNQGRTNCHNPCYQQFLSEEKFQRNLPNPARHGLNFQFVKLTGIWVTTLLWKEWQLSFCFLSLSQPSLLSPFQSYQAQLFLQCQAADLCSVATRSDQSQNRSNLLAEE